MKCTSVEYLLLMAGSLLASDKYPMCIIIAEKPQGSVTDRNIVIIII